MGTKRIKNRQYGTSMDNLTTMQRNFVQALMADPKFSGAEAARKAGYSAPAVAACKLMKSRAVRAVLGKQQRLREERCQLSGDKVLQELYYLAMRDVIDLCDENGYIAIDDMRKIPERMRRCIDGMEVTQTTDPKTGEVEQTIKIRLSPKVAAVKLAMEHFGQLAPVKHEHEVSVNWDELVRKIDTRDHVEAKLLTVESEAVDDEPE